ncbi:hypothetical protein C8R48DRAFT_670838 [Suillus tomentosus]|nr:hypothetical protein C8R48DRAFT_670838 [Suillus tomentosus]
MILNLESTSARFLVSSSPIKSVLQPPKLVTSMVSPIKKSQSGGATSQAFPASMNEEQKLQRMVDDLTAQVACLKEQVQKQEKDNVRLNSNGMPWLLTSDKFFKEVLRHQAQQEAKVAAKEQRQQAQEKRSKEIVEWEEKEEAQKARNAMRKTE